MSTIDERYLDSILGPSQPVSMEEAAIRYAANLRGQDLLDDRALEDLNADIARSRPN